MSYEIGEKAYLRVTPLKGFHFFGINGKLAPRYVGHFPVIAKCGELAYQVELPSTFPDLHDVFHVSQLKRCFNRHRPNGITLKCISTHQGQELLRDIHAGECGHHASAITLAGKAYHNGFYWTLALLDVAEIVKRCEAYQFHAKQIHQPVQELQTIPLTWPFAVWGLDILGLFPCAQGGYRYLYVAIDEFTKWAEVEPVHTIPARSAVKFIRGLVCRFGVPNHIITNNGSQFTSELF
jgi:hypothetical protein